MLEQVIEITEKAGELVLEHYASKSIVATAKEDMSPVTEADLQADSLIRKLLSKNFDIPIVTEENPIPYEDRKQWDEFFLVDPLDGTKNFLAKDDEFTVNIALVKDRRPVLGVIFAPALGELFYASLDGGAFKKSKHGLEKLPRIQCAGRAAAVSRFHGSGRSQRFLTANHVTEFISVGSALKFCRLAEGSVNLYPRFVRSMEWDIAAGHILIKEAGCRIVDLKTHREPVYNKRNMANSFFVAHSEKIPFEELSLKVTKA